MAPGPDGDDDGYDDEAEGPAGGDLVRLTCLVRQVSVRSSAESGGRAMALLKLGCDEGELRAVVPAALYAQSADLLLPGAQVVVHALRTTAGEETIELILQAVEPVE